MDGTRIGMTRSHQYYHHKQTEKDWTTKQMIEIVLRDHPAYGHKRLALHLKINKKRVLRVMKLFGIKPYRRYTKKPFMYKPKDLVFPNLLMIQRPTKQGDIYASDFTYIKFQGKWVYVATILDIYTREIVGVSILLTHSTQLVLNALGSAVLHRAVPNIIHSDQGSEYTSKNYSSFVQNLGIQQSMSKPGCPWENGYQESFYKGFKLDLGDPKRFETLGELVAEIYATINYHNKKRIHTALGMTPMQFAKKQHELCCW
jgi:transposase InsO family protein